MPQRSNEEVVNAYLQALIANDAQALGALRHPDWVLEYPQSGERIRGHANDRAIADHYPGGVPELDPEAPIGSEDRWVVSPSFTYERIAGSGDVWFANGRALYADGSIWFVANIYRLRDGLIVHETTFWAAAFDPPAWRAQWVELMEPAAG